MHWIVGLAVALALHMTAGWPFGIAGGAVAGYLAGERGWLWGGLAVGLAWLALVGYSFVVAAEPTRAMLSVMGRLLGNLPDSLFVVLSVLPGVLLGVAGGLVGAQLHRVLRASARPRRRR